MCARLGEAIGKLCEALREVTREEMCERFHHQDRPTPTLSRYRRWGVLVVVHVCNLEHACPRSLLGGMIRVT